MSEISEEMKDDLPESVFLVVGKQLFPLKNDITTLGRSSENDLIIYEPDISRQHAEIRNENGNYVLYDLHATYGTFINGEKTERAFLKSGDTVSLASTPLLFIDKREVKAKILDATRGLKE